MSLKTQPLIKPSFDSLPSSSPVSSPSADVVIRITPPSGSSLSSSQPTGSLISRVVARSASAPSLSNWPLPSVDQESFENIWRELEESRIGAEKFFNEVGTEGFLAPEMTGDFDPEERALTLRMLQQRQDGTISDDQAKATDLVSCFLLEEYNITKINGPAVAKHFNVSADALKDMCKECGIKYLT